jgi:hypothetical protein
MKIKRDAFLYLDPRPPKEDFAQCSTCRMFLPEQGLCSLHGKDVEIKPTMSCGFYTPGGPADESELEHVSKAVTPEESGLVDREVRCENCISFDKGKCKLFEMLNQNPNWNCDPNVDKHGCCNAQRPIEKRKTLREIGRA